MKREIAWAVVCGFGLSLTAGWVAAHPGAAAGRQTGKQEAGGLAPSARLVHDRLSGPVATSKAAFLLPRAGGDLPGASAGEGSPDSAPPAVINGIQPSTTPSSGSTPGPGLPPVEMLFGIATTIIGLALVVSNDEAESC